VNAITVSTGLDYSLLEVGCALDLEAGQVFGPGVIHGTHDIWPPVADPRGAHRLKASSERRANVRWISVDQNMTDSSPVKSLGFQGTL
jgi:hypothetical protein